jgi:hypothetical protein
MSLIARFVKGPHGLGRLLILFLILLVELGQGCGSIRPVPEGWNPEDYTPVAYEQILAPRKAGLSPGQKVSVAGYFWQYLDYDPFMVPNYLTLARQPRAWSRLCWASLYRTPQMQGYCDRLALTREQQQDWHLRRLEHVRVFGQLASLGFGVLYLQAHHVDRLDLEEGPLNQHDTPPAGEGQENPGL